MRLHAIEALRYGALEGECLNDLGPGLTVVLGPNESGKSTMTALTRHVLYGFPDARTKEHGYVPVSGPRSGRLVFGDESGEWAIERVDGKNRGPVTVAARSGADRPGLISELTSGVTEHTYRVVFGFGLDELAEIESGDNADIVARLYAAGTGLSVNPIDARRELESRASALYAPRASKPVVNALASRIRECKDQIRSLEAAAAAYAGEQARLRELAEQLAPLKERVAELDARGRVLDRDAQRLSDAVTAGQALQEQAAALDSTLSELDRGAGMIDVDERVLAVAPELTAILEDTSAFRERLEAISAREADAAEARRRAAEGSELPADAVDSVATRAEVENRRDLLIRLRTESEAALRGAEAAEARASSTDRAAEALARPAHVARRSRTPLVLSIVAILAGGAFVAVGVALSQLVAAALGGLLVLAGVIALTVALIRKPAELAAAPLSTDAARARVEAEASRAMALSAAAALETAQAEWRAWLAGHHLDAYGEDPVAVRRLLEELAERQRLVSEAGRYTAEAERAREAAEAWVERLVAVTCAFDGSAGQMPPLSMALELAARARHTLDRARADAADRAQIVRDLEAARAESRKLAERLEAARVIVAEIVARHELSDADPLPALEVFSAQTAADLAAARDAAEGLAKEHARLSGVLDNEGRDDAMARARQELEGLGAQADDAGDRFVVGSLAVRLLDGARERFERERQPEVVRTAGRVFSAMTGGRYTDVRVPLDGSGISVLSADGSIRTSAALSRGTAEQLYLALRVGLIGSLGALGSALPVLMDDVVVNFDPERRAGALVAIGELAALRQVLFFTCHPETAEALHGAVAGSTLVTLDRCALR